MWSSSPFIPPPPLSCGAWVPGSEAVLEYGVTEATLAATGDTSTADTALFADSGFRPGSGFRRGSEPSDGRGRSGEPLLERVVDGGMVEQAEVVGAPDV